MEITLPTSIPLERLKKHLLGEDAIEYVYRPASVIIKKQIESEEIACRIIVLPPFGHTADKPNEMNPHPEVRKARITVKGAIRPKKVGFSALKNVLKVCYSKGRTAETQPDTTYLAINPHHPNYREVLKSSKQSFFVTQENGDGFYHSLINNSDEWLVLILEKYFALNKRMNIAPFLNLMEESERNRVEALVETVSSTGDALFASYPELVEDILLCRSEKILPALIEALNIQETGKHQPCTIFAMIIKVARQNPAYACRLIQKAKNENSAPGYYLVELAKKMSCENQLFVSRFLFEGNVHP